MGAVKKLNLTRIKVNKELSFLALIHPKQTHKILLQNPEFRKILLDYILQTIPSKHLLIESSEDFYELREIIKCTPQERTQIYNLVDQRINQLRNNQKSLSRQPISFGSGIKVS